MLKEIKENICLSIDETDEFSVGIEAYEEYVEIIKCDQEITLNEYEFRELLSLAPKILDKETITNIIQSWGYQYIDDIDNI
jgi:hypothetical protein